MRNVTPRKAERKGQRLRLALDGPTGSGKTWTALQVATELTGNGRILVVDTEQGTSALYSDDFDFDVIEWIPPYDPRELRPVLMEQAEVYDCIIVDSLSHFWNGEGGTLSIVDQASKRFNGNTYAGWSEGTPAQNDLVSSIVNAACHIIVTMRSKMEYVLAEGKNGKSMPQKVGMAPVQRDGLEYEMTVVASLEVGSHAMTVTKSRCSDVADKVYTVGHHIEMATTLKDWLNGAAQLLDPAAVRALVIEFDNVADEQARRALKGRFVSEWGRPERLTVEQEEPAKVWIADQVVQALEAAAKVAGVEETMAELNGATE